VPGIQNGTTTTIEAEQVTIMVAEAMHTWAAGMKEQSIRIEINRKATSKESLNKAVRTMKVITKSRMSLRRRQRTELQKPVQAQSNKK
jgi:hypothetical protein